MRALVLQGVLEKVCKGGRGGERRGEERGEERERVIGSLSIECGHLFYRECWRRFVRRGEEGG